MEVTIEQIAESFSLGEFDRNFDYLSDDVEWIIYREKYLKGKPAVLEHCKQVAEYFRSVTTDFKTLNVIKSTGRVAVNGEARFIREEKIVAIVNSCDVYEFVGNSLIAKIYSYCINEEVS